MEALLNGKSKAKSKLLDVYSKYCVGVFPKIVIVYSSNAENLYNGYI